MLQITRDQNIKKNIDEYKHTAQSDLDHQKQHVLSLSSIIMGFLYLTKRFLSTKVSKCYHWYWQLIIHTQCEFHFSRPDVIEFDQVTIPISHVVPENPRVQRQENPSHSSTQRPPFLQLSTRQWPLGEERGHLSRTLLWWMGLVGNVRWLTLLIRNSLTQPTKSCELIWPGRVWMVSMSLSPPRNMGWPFKSR